MTPRPIHEMGIALIKHFEGFSPVVYRDVAGKATIGYGHLLRDGEAWERLSEAEAEGLLRQDIAVAERAVSHLIRIPLTDNQFAALVSFTFNLGSGALQRSTLRQKINREEHGDVPRELMRWVWAGGRQNEGLKRRRKAECALYTGNLSTDF